MNQFYHWTNKSNLQSILKNGLKTGKELGIQNYYFGEPIDNRYIYLAKKPEELPEKPDFCMLSIELPDRHPIERDYDLAIFLQGGWLMTPMQTFLDTIKKIKQLGIQPVDETFDFTSREKITRVLQEATDLNWDKAFAFYRTKKSIPNKKPYRIKLLA